MTILYVDGPETPFHLSSQRPSRPSLRGLVVPQEHTEVTSIAGQHYQRTQIMHYLSKQE